MSTIKDVSRTTGLSISTISKYINGGNVREENRALIDGAIKALDFKVNQAARSLKTNKTMKVGVLLPSLDVSFFAGIVADIESRLLREGYNAIVCSYNHDPELEKRKLAFLIDQQPDGLVLVAEHATAADLLAFREIRERVMPVVFLDRAVEGMPADFVLVDSASICRMATEQFILNGHRKIGFIMGPEDISTAKERYQGYREALQKHGIALREDYVRSGDYTVNTGYRLFSEMVEKRDRPTAVLVTNYELSLGAITAALEHKLRIPQDVSFIGFDDPQLTQIVNPPITIVLQPTDQIAAETASLLLRRMRGDHTGQPQTVVLKACLLLHDSIRTID